MKMPGRPPRDADGAPVFFVPKSVLEQDDEQRLCVWFACQSVLFGNCYRQLMPSFFDKVRLDSGVMIATTVPSRDILPAMSFPGDIDLLIIPYVGDHLLVTQTLAVEVKIVRAKFHAQGKSPNDFGFSQANGMVRHGFPFVGVAHLIVSDSSPMKAWRSMHAVDVIDAESGRVSEPREVFVDMLPADLIKRSYGRLLKNCQSKQVGLLAAYMGEGGNWIPDGRQARKNRALSRETLNAIAHYYRENLWRFRDLPRFPDDLQRRKVSSAH